MKSHAEMMIGMLEEKEKTFLSLFLFPDGDIAKIEVETFEEDNLVDNFCFIFKNQKNRQKKTLEKLGITKEECEKGIEEKEGLRCISEYFVKHECIFGYNLKKDIRKINKKMMEHELKCIDCRLFDVGEELEYCGISTEDDIKKDLKRCLRQYKNILKMEWNKVGCVLNYAYYHESEFRKWTVRKCIFCSTSVGVIYYDIENDVWGMTKKEQKKIGKRIENFDIDDIKKQLRNKYKVINMSELYEKLTEKVC